MHFNIGSAFSAKRLYKDAEIHYKQCIKYKQNNIPAYLCLGEVFSELNDLGQAENAFK